MDAGTVRFGDTFGAREYLKNNYMYRTLAAVSGMYGNSEQDAMYPFYGVDSDGEAVS